MDAEALKIVLKLHEENVILKRALVEAKAIIKSKQQFLSLRFPYGEPQDPYGLVPLFQAIDELLFEKEKEPANNSKDANENAG